MLRPERGPGDGHLGRVAHRRQVHLDQVVEPPAERLGVPGRQRGDGRHAPIEARVPAVGQHHRRARVERRPDGRSAIGGRRRPPTWPSVNPHPRPAFVGTGAVIDPPPGRAGRSATSPRQRAGRVRVTAVTATGQPQAFRYGSNTRTLEHEFDSALERSGGAGRPICDQASPQSVRSESAGESAGESPVSPQSVPDQRGDPHAGDDVDPTRPVRRPDVGRHRHRQPPPVGGRSERAPGARPGHAAGRRAPGPPRCTLPYRRRPGICWRTPDAGSAARSASRTRPTAMPRPTSPPCGRRRRCWRRARGRCAAGGAASGS